MIKQINSTSRYVEVYSPSNRYIGSNSTDNMMVGSVRFNTSLQWLEVYDGSSWVAINSANATVSLTHEAESLLDWAKKKKADEEQLLAMAKDNPAIQDLLEQKKKLEEQIEVVKILTKTETTA